MLNLLLHLHNTNTIISMFLHYPFITFNKYSFFSDKMFLNNNKAAFEIQVLSKSAIKCQRKFRIFQFALATRWQKNCQRLTRNLCISNQQWLHHTSAFCQGPWFGFLTVDTTYSTNIILFTYNTLNGRNRREYFSHWSPCFGFFVCPWEHII